MQPDGHSKKYAAFLDGLTAYLQRAAKPREPRKGRDLDALLVWRDQPSGEPIQSNWSTSCNDNAPASEDADVEEHNYAAEMVREIVPSVGQMMKQVREGEYEYRSEPQMFRDYFGPHPLHKNIGWRLYEEVLREFREVHAIPIGGDIERNQHGQVVRIGKLRFSDGSQTEQATVRGPDGKVIEARVRMRTGAMLGTRERLRKEKGGSAAWGADNATWAKMLDGKPKPAQTLKIGALRRGKSFSATESRAMLALATANTVNMPIVTKCPPGLPYKPERVADIFLAGKKSRCAGGGSTSWQEQASALVSRTEWLKARAELLSEDVAVLDAVMTARNYGDIGAVVGKSRKAGPRLLKAANDNLAAAIKKFVA